MDFTILYIYIVFVAAASLWLSWKGTFYIFSPFITIYISHAVGGVVPLLLYDDVVTRNLIYVTNLSCVINMATFFIFRKDMVAKAVDFNVHTGMGINVKRRKLTVFFLCFIVFYGFVSGVTPALLAGVDTENMRRTNEIGLGFLTKIPGIAIPLLLLAYMFNGDANKIKRNFVIAMVLGSITFFASAGRGALLAYFEIFLVWFCFKHRAMKWWEYYFVFYILNQVVAAFLLGIRQGVWNPVIALDNFFGHQMMIFGANTVPLMNSINDSHLLWGMSYYYPIVALIPRFLWPDKPVSIDYYYKDLVDYDFDGGGIYTTVPNDFYLNFGTYFFIAYIAWILLLHLLYRKIIKSKISTHTRLIVLMILTCHSSIGPMIEYVQLILLFLIITYFVNKRWNVY